MKLHAQIGEEKRRRTVTVAVAALQLAAAALWPSGIEWGPKKGREEM